MIQHGQRACRKRWFTSDSLLSLLGFPTVDLIENTLPPKILIEQVKREHLKSKECIEHIDHIHMAEIKELIESPITSEMKINLFLQE